MTTLRDTKIDRWFWKWLLSLSLFLVFGILSGMSLHGLWKNSQRTVSTPSVIVPSPKWTPLDVVSIQLKSLSAIALEHEDAEVVDALRQCFEFASPANRENTGPEARFFTLVQTEPYAALTHCVRYAIGEPVIVDDQYATLLVTVMDKQSNVNLYRFFLSKQSQSPYDACWMTDSVVWIEEYLLPQKDEDRTKKLLFDNRNRMQPRVNSTGEFHFHNEGVAG